MTFLYGCMICTVTQWGLSKMLNSSNRNWKIETLFCLFFAGCFYGWMEKENQALNLYIFVVLVIMSYYDLKTKSVPDTLQIFLLLGGVYTCMIQERTIVMALLAITPGLILFGMHFFGSAIGGADGKMLVSLGLYFGFTSVIGGLFYASLIAVIFHLKLLIQKNMKYEIPFIPFLSLGIMIQYLVPLEYLSFIL